MATIGSRRRWALVLTLAALASACSGRPASSPTTTAAPGPSARPPASAPDPTEPPAPPPPLPPLFYEKSGRIFVSEPAGKAGVAFTPPPEGTCDAEPAPAPEANYVAFVRRPCSDAEAGQLWVTRRDRPNPRLLFDPATLPEADGLRVMLPLWSPRGDQVAFLVSDRAGARRLLVIDPLSGELLHTLGPAGFAGLAWSRLGADLAFVAGGPIDGVGKVGVLHTATGAVADLVSATAPSSVTFEVDGRTLLFSNRASARPPSSRTVVDGDAIFRARMTGGPPDQVFATRALPGDVAVVGNGPSLSYTEVGPRLRAVVTRQPDDATATPLANDLLAAAPGPRWFDQTVASIVEGTGGQLVVQTLGRDRTLVDRGVSSFAWPLRFSPPPTPAPAGGRPPTP